MHIVDSTLSKISTSNRRFPKLYIRYMETKTIFVLNGIYNGKFSVKMNFFVTLYENESRREYWTEFNLPQKMRWYIIVWNSPYIRLLKTYLIWNHFAQNPNMRRFFLLWKRRREKAITDLWKISKKILIQYWTFSQLSRCKKKNHFTTNCEQKYSKLCTLTWSNCNLKKEK